VIGSRTRRSTGSRGRTGGGGGWSGAAGQGRLVGGGWLAAAYSDGVPRRLVPVDLGALPVPAALDRLTAALDGSGDALLPLPPDPAGRSALLPLRPGEPLGAGEDDDGDPTALVLATSGSTGAPKGALLHASALRSSAAATHRRLGGPATWLLALGPHHVAGVQVLVRSVVAGTEPDVLDLTEGFRADAFAAATDRLAERAADRRCTALVPTQLGRLLDAGGAGLRALASYDAVLVGGAATPPALLTRARDAGVRVVTTYGMSETCGGCVYDDRPLDDVRVRVVDGVVRLGGPVVARGYRGRPSSGAFLAEDGSRWFVTSDAGDWDGDRLRVLGRADDVLVTGGLKLAPQAVEAVLAEDPDVRECLVVGVPDAEWGQRVVAVVVPRDGASPPALDRLRRLVVAALGAHAAPRALVEVPELPLRGPGKPDRRAAREIAVRAAP
jgi:O-succinylbenzoic acid--CoA ligase